MSLKAHQQQKQKQPQLHILITGSSQGIGLAAAQQLVQEGHVVYHACRSQERAQQAVKAAGGGVALKACNLADLQSVKEFCSDVKQRVPHLDVLCLNAGIAPSTITTSSRPALTTQGFEAGIGVNHLGHFLLVQLLLDKLRSSCSSRIVITASSVHDPALKAGQSGGKGATLGDLSGLGISLRENPTGPTMIDGERDYHGAKVYKDSKLCNILMARQLHVLYSHQITTVSFNPGFVPTTGLFESMRQESWWKAQALTLFAKVMGFSIPVDTAGRRLVTLATLPQPQLQNGAYYCAPAKSQGVTPVDGFVPTPVSTEASNNELATKLWNKSIDVVRAWL